MPTSHPPFPAPEPLTQAFAPGVAEQIALSRHALRAHECEVTVLFADLRDFSSLCQQLPTSEAYELLNEVMDRLTEAVMEQAGVLIDYYGDGLAAMWNAPVSQANHPELACRAGLAMLEAMPSVSTRWQHLLPAPLRLGVGIHTGNALVGNIGSTQRIKYGPRGATVNLASRVESATKILGLPLVVTQAVSDRLHESLGRWRICRATLPGVEEEVDLFGLRPREDKVDDLSWATAAERYGEALAYYESGKLAEAAALLQEDCERKNFPARFLARQIEEDLHRRLGRRVSDAEQPAHGSAIALPVK